MTTRDMKKVKSNTRTTTETKFMSELPYKALKDLSDRLDLLKDGKTAYWRELAREMDYSSVNVEHFGLNAGKLNGSPGYSLLLDMSNRGITYDELVAMLKKLQLYEALVTLGHKEDVRITKQPVSTPVMVGQTLELECVAEGVPRPKYLWFKGQTPLVNERGSKLIIKNVNLDHGGVYLCRAENEANFVFSQWIEVQVQNPITKKGIVPQGSMNPDTPKFIEHPQPQILEVGQKLYLTCQAQGSGPLEYQWFRNGEALVYGTGPDLIIGKVQMADQGVYVCCVKTPNTSSALSKGAQVVVNQQVMSSSPPSHAPLPQHQMFPPPHHPAPYPIDIQHMDFHQFQQHPSPLPGPPPDHLYPQQEGPPFHRIPNEPPIDLIPPIFTPMISPGLVPEHYPSYIPQTHNSNGVRCGGASPSGMPPLPSSGPGGASVPIQMNTPDSPAGQDYFENRSCSDKVALLIGNKDYHVNTLRLNTPENDTQDLTGILQSADFKVVSLVNLTKKEMETAVNYFTQLIGPNVYALFFFAGHGFELNSMNYMMAVDCTKEKNPKYCVCAQMVLRMMQERGAKLSVVLLDMCRVPAPQIPITDMSEVYEKPYPARSYPGYHIFGFSCSTAEKAYEVAADNPDDIKGDEADELGLVGKDNSIFVAALKKHLQIERGSLKDTVQSLLSATAKSVHKHKPSNVDSQWQRPEISSNLGEDLSLDDRIDHTLLPDQQLARSKLWKEAHSIPDVTIVSSVYGQMVLRLSFEAEHTNVLIIQAEVLQGPLAIVEVKSMDMHLILQERPVPWILASAVNEYHSPHMAIQKSIANKNLFHFKIPDLQKITTNEVTLQINAMYRWKDSRKVDEDNWLVQSDQINYPMAPPLYGKIIAHEEERKRQNMAGPPPRHHVIPSGPPLH